jgi:hypothetical protein
MGLDESPETQPMVTVQGTASSLGVRPGTAPHPAVMLHGAGQMGGATGLHIKQAFDVLEFITGCEARNRYRVHTMSGETWSARNPRIP